MFKKELRSLKTKCPDIRYVEFKEMSPLAALGRHDDPKK